MLRPENLMHPRILELARVLMPMVENPVERPTRFDRDKLVLVRETIKRVPEEPDINLDPRDQADRQFLYVTATELARQQEDFYQENGGWEPPTKEHLIAMGGKALLDDDLLRLFPCGNLADFAAKELPGIRRALRVRTLGQLAGKTRVEIMGPAAQNAGNKTLEWIASVCGEFKIEPPK